MRRILIILGAVIWSVCAITNDAMAHTPQVTADCAGVHVSLTNYEGSAHNNHFMHQMDGHNEVTIEDFGGSLSGTLTWPTAMPTHTFTWWIDANTITGDLTQWDTPHTTLTVHNCPVPTTTTTTTTAPIPTSTTTQETLPSTTQSPSPSTTTTTLPPVTSTSGTTAPTSSTPDTSPVTPPTTSPVTSAVPSTTSAPLPTTTPTTPNTPSPTASSSAPVPGVTSLPVTGTATGGTAALALILLTIGIAVLMVARPQKTKRK